MSTREQFDMAWDRIQPMFCWLRHLFHGCPCRPMDDETGCWGECVDCGKRFGFVSRAELRAYIEREERFRAHYDEKIIPLPDESYRWFEKALLETTTITPMRAKAILRQCWRDIHNSCVSPDSKD